jgi:hypothetical protein
MIEIGDCKLPKDDPLEANHTAADVEGACVHGVHVLTQNENLVQWRHAETCGECFFFQRRKANTNEHQRAPGSTHEQQ